MSLKARLLAKSPQNGESRGRLQIKEISDTGDLDKADTIGAAMRSARLVRGIDISKAAADLRIRREHLEAIEDGDPERIPERAYALGFVRAYASYLSLDVDDCLHRFKNEMTADAPATPKSGFSFPEVREEVRLPQGSLLIMAVLLAFGVYGGWYLSVSADRMVTERVPPVPDRLVEASTATPEPVTEDSTEAIGGPTLVVQNPADENATIVSEAVSEGETISLGAADQSMQIVALAPEDAESLNTVEPNSGGRAYGDIFGSPRIVLRAKSKAWLRVEDSSSQVLIQQEMLPNDLYYAPGETGLILSVRDAGAFEVVLDGDVQGTLGKPGQVLPSVSLDPDMIGLLGLNRAQ